MTKTTLETLVEFLAKAKKHLSDEEPDAYEQADEAPGGADEDLSEQNEADQSLEGQDPEAAPSEENDEEGEEEPTERQVISAPPEKQRTAKYSEEELQPTREELNETREYTRPWEQRSRDRDSLEAQADKNPIKHKRGRLVESRNLSHADRQKEYEKFSNTNEYKNADPISQMEMDSKFHNDWHQKNPEQVMNALTSHGEAHKKGEVAREFFKQIKKEKIAHIASGGVQPGAYSLEEGVQHAGGSREDEDSAPSGIIQDKSAQFASGNQEFLQRYMKDQDKHSKQYDTLADLENYDPGTRADINRVLGEHSALKDPAKQRKMDDFTAKYHPLIGKAAKRVINKLGLAEQVARGQIDPGLLHEAGVHALFQSVNDYDHDHPSKAKFVTHLNRKMHGLMQSALKTLDEIPTELRAGAKKFDKDKRVSFASPVIHTNKEGVTTTIAPPVPKPSAPELIDAKYPSNVDERHKRIVAAKAPMKRPASAAIPAVPKAGPKMHNVQNVKLDDDGNTGEE